MNNCSSSQFLWTVWLIIVILTEVNSHLNISLNFIILIANVVQPYKCFLDPQISNFKNSVLQIHIQEPFLKMVLKKVAQEGPHITIIQTVNKKVIGNLKQKWKIASTHSKAMKYYNVAQCNTQPLSYNKMEITEYYKRNRSE